MDVTDSRSDVASAEIGDKFSTDPFCFDAVRANTRLEKCETCADLCDALEDILSTSPKMTHLRDLDIQASLGARVHVTRTFRIFMNSHPLLRCGPNFKSAAHREVSFKSITTRIDKKASCQFSKNETSETYKRKMSRRNIEGLVPPIECPAWIIVSENGEGISVKYFSKHNYELCPQNIKFQPIKKTCMEFIKANLQMGIEKSKIPSFENISSYNEITEDVECIPDSVPSVTLVESSIDSSVEET
ncbi:hypothetical protein TNIN_259181 [Trichonephila inaurata madagascariensis]|uniref:Uncharacterized protein n=1 Tax=Trichonephila inaurata madagascariensis TaxID=2747483 RepID=A0A8X7BXE8_9ARAC|nr:hypothetical protein TNIN_259181 [Trichonephila inaurata madagascariensis]